MTDLPGDSAARPFDRSVEPEAPLRDCFQFCATFCVVECCGIDAITTERERIELWIGEVGPQRAAKARRQLVELLQIVRTAEPGLVCASLNACVVDDTSRASLVDFLSAFLVVFGESA